jgi:anti-sigma regulatory factor (Ser/Thr protein kinase)
MDEYMSSVRVWGLTCPGFLEEVSHARRWTRDILSHSPCADDAALIVSELGTNALVHTASGHAPGAFHITLALSEHVVAISVTDSGSADTTPRVEHPDDDTPRGRGLSMVATLATHVQVHGDHHGRTITAELRIPPPRREDTPWL